MTEAKWRLASWPASRPSESVVYPDGKIPASHPNLPPLFEEDDWLWVAQSLGYVRFSGEDDGFDARHRMDRIIARILEYRAEDVRKAQKCPG